MADNVSITQGSGTTVAADDVGGVLHQRVKLSLGADGVASDAPVGGGVEAACLRVTVASDSTGVLSVDDNGSSLTVDNPHLTNALGGEYETVAASQTAQVLGGSGAVGDYLAGVLVVPANLNPGAVSILDNATSITIFTGGAASITELRPFFIPLRMTSVSGAWKVTTGADVSVVAVGNFSA